MEDRFSAEADRLAALINAAGTHSEKEHIVWEAWCYGFKHSFLFDQAGPRAWFFDDFPKEKITNTCGCLTQIKSTSGEVRAWTHELTAEILNDVRIPGLPSAVIEGNVRENLEVFVEWQRRLYELYPAETRV